MNIEAIIRQKAEKKLINEIKDFCIELNNKKFFKSLGHINVIIPEEYKAGDHAQSLTGSLNEYYPEKGLCKVIFDMFFEDYVTTEAKAFMDKVEKSANKTSK